MISSEGAGADAASSTFSLSSARIVVGLDRARYQAKSAPAMIRRIGHFGIPGRSISAISTIATMTGIRGTEASWRKTSVLSCLSAEERVTMIPVAMAMIKAGNWVAMPSPMVRSV